jgi:hypothetical protein
MNKKIGLYIAILIIVLVLLCILIFKINKKDIKPEINYVSEISLNKKNWIHSMKKYKIEGTDNTFQITRKVKFDADTGDGNTTVSFAIEIPYTITVDGTEYNGVYILGDIAENEQYNPEYNVEITNLTQDGAIQVKLEYK